MTDGFTQILFAWLNQVKADGSLPASAFKVAFELGQFLNGEIFAGEGAMQAWPSLTTIAAGIVMGERTAREMMQRLIAAGHVAVRTGHGPGNPSRYTLIVQNRQTPPALNRQPNAGLNRQATAALEMKPAEYDTKTGRLPPHKSGRRPPTNYSTNYSKNNSKERLSPADRFEEFWRGYPKRVAKEAARRAYRGALKKGSATEDRIIAGARRYAEERRGQEERFTKHPATWLNGACWQDEPERITPEYNHNQADRRPRFLDGLADYAEDYEP